MSWAAANLVCVTGLPLVVCAVTGWGLVRLRAGRGAVPSVTPRSAIVVAAAAWVVFFGYGTVVAIKYLLAPWRSRQYLSFASVGADLLKDYVPQVAAAVLLFAFVRRWSGTGRRGAGLAWPVPGPRPARQVVGWTLCGFLALCLFSAWATWMQGSGAGPWTRSAGTPPEPWQVLDGLASAVRAAVTEEIVVVAVPVLLLRAAGRRIGPLVIVVLLAARLSYHLYYGWGSLGVLVWAPLFLWLYIARETLWPLIAAHVVFDGLIAGLGQAGYDGLGQLIGVTLMMLAGAFLVIESGLFLRRTRRAFRVWLAGNPDVLGELGACCSSVAGQRVRLVPSVRETGVARSVRGKDRGYEIRIGPGLDLFGAAGRTALLTREAARIGSGAVALAAAPPWHRRVLMVVAPALLVSALTLAGVGEAAGQTWGVHVAAALTVAAVALAIGGEIVEYRRRQLLEDAAAARAVALVGRSGMDQIAIDKQRLADPLMSLADQLAHCAVATRLTAAMRIDHATQPEQT
jgi:hypothetical protein